MSEAPTPSAPLTSPYGRITASIVSAIERSVAEGKTLTCPMPWHHNGSPASRPVNAVTGQAYRGVNVLALWMSAQASGHSTGVWATYRQWSSLGAQVRKGEQGAAAVVWKTAKPKVANTLTEEAGEVSARSIHLLARTFVLFNADQVDGWTPPKVPHLDPATQIAAAEAYVARLGIGIERGGEEAYYQPSTDTVHLPHYQRFRDPVSELAVRLHECAHATAAPHRLDRDLSGRFGSEAYAMEECVAELTASFVLSDLGLAHEPREDHAAYIASWLTVLRRDPRAIFTAASHAQQAADWMKGRQG